MAERNELKVGNKAPAFSLPDKDGHIVNLSDFVGQWVVLYFYPKDDTPACTTESCDFTRSINQFANLNAAVLGVSPDTSDSHRNFTRKYRLKVTLLSDVDRTVLHKYGAWGIKKLYGREFVGVIRSTVLIDPKGQIAHHWPNAKATGHAERVRQKLTQLLKQIHMDIRSSK